LEIIVVLKVLLDMIRELDALDRAVSESSLRAHKDYVGEMNGCIRSLKELGADTSYLEKQVSNFPNK